MREQSTAQKSLEQPNESPSSHEAQGESPTPPVETKEPLSDGKSAGELAPTKPLILASQSLREDLEPSEPGRFVSRVLAVGCALAGTLAVAIWGSLSGLDFLSLSLFAATAAAGILPLGYGLRAGVLTGVACTLLALLLMHDNYVRPLGVPWLTLGTMVLGAGLFLRSTYRASLASRVLVGLGIVVTLMAFVLQKGWTEWVIEDTRWHSWIPFALWGALLVLLLLSLLAFMDESSTGGANYSAVGLMIWFGANTCVRALVPNAGGLIALSSARSAFVPAVHGASMSQASVDMSGEFLAVGVSESVLVVLFAFGLAQLLGVVRLKHLRGPEV